VAELNHQAQRELLGGYLLGLLTPEEQLALARHLRGCPACQQELAELAPLPALLRRTTQLERGTDPVPSQTGVCEPEDSGHLAALENAVRRRSQAGARRRERRWRRVAVAALLAAVGLAAADLGFGGQQPAPAARVGQGAGPGASVVATAALRPPGQGGPAVGQALLVPRAWGTEVRVVLTGRVSGSGPRSCLLLGSQGQVLAGTWAAARVSPEEVTMASAWRWRTIRRVEVIAQGRVVLSGQVVTARR